MEALENAVIRLLKRRPFYGHLLLGLRRRLSADGRLPGITLLNGQPTLSLDPAVFSGYSAAEQEAVLEHLLKHLLHLHPLRGKGRLALLWDVACDLAINPSIDGLPVGAATPEHYRLPHGETAEAYYQALRRPFDTGNLSGDGYGTALEAAQGATGSGEALAPAPQGRQYPLDDHGVWAAAESTPLRLAEEAVRGVVTRAWQQSGGEVPGELGALVGQWLSPAATAWPQMLRQFVATAGRLGRRSTWKREHRRFAHATPGLRKERRLELLVAIDVSDSTDRQPLREAFARELLRIARGRHSHITVLYSGSRIQKIVSFSGQPTVAEVYRGGGFTDLRPVFAHARQMQPRPAAIIYLTDGFGPAPAEQEFPTLWVLTPDGRKPVDWGVELRLEREVSLGD